MNKKDLDYWIMYHEIHKLTRLGFSKAKIARHLVMDPRTVQKFLQMSEADFEAYLTKQYSRSKVLAPYEEFVKNKLTEFEDTSAAQMFDWLKEYHPDLPPVSVRTAYNFVMYVRQKHNIPVVKDGSRTYFPVEELPYGDQAQVDFGQYNMRTPDKRRKKVYFFTIVLSRSRMKYVWFSDAPFTAQTMCQAHENAFDFFGGIPKTIVYDQDTIMVVDENIGDIILTDTFRKYTSARSFQMYFCRKSDPETKGKIENVVKYVKNNFLYNRVFYELETLNTDGLAWLTRTANHLQHNYTKKSPQAEFTKESPYLKPYTPLPLENNEQKKYAVRKNNQVSYHSNFYSVPEGTYQKGIWTVEIRKNQDNTIDIFDQAGQLLGKHTLSPEKGKTIINNNHKRDRSKSIAQMIETTASYFSNPDVAHNYLHQIKKAYPRYCRDHLQHMIKTLRRENNISLANRTLEFCVENQLFSAHEFDQVLQVFAAETKEVKTPDKIKLLGGAQTFSAKAEEVPEKSEIETYEKYFGN